MTEEDVKEYEQKTQGMTKEEKNVFSLRIANSSKTELIVITYDIIVNYVDAACDAYSKEDLDLVVFNLQKAKQFLNNLIELISYRQKNQSFRQIPQKQICNDYP